MPEPVPQQGPAAALETSGLGKRYGRRWALAGCTLTIPAGRVAGLVGPNGAGKTTLLHLAAGLLRPTAGTIAVLGERPAGRPAQLRRVGFVAQDTPVYRGLSVAAHLRLGAALNPAWDTGLATRRVASLGLSPRQRAGRLSGGERAQLALTLAIAKRPDLLVLDEPVASLDPLARREFLDAVAEVVAGHGMTVVLSSHLITDLAQICDYLIVLVASTVRVAGRIDELLAAHHRLTGPAAAPVPAGVTVIESAPPPSRPTPQTPGPEPRATVLARGPVPAPGQGWTCSPASLDDLVLAYLGGPSGQRPTGVVR